MMNLARLLNPVQRSCGQAMTEFVVCVGFIFLGLFVIVPLFGKIQNVKFQNLQASRYVAWERTVWLEDKNAWNSSGHDNSDDFVVSNKEFESLAVRSKGDLLNTVKNRFFYNQGSGKIKPISSDDADGSKGKTSPLWTYQQSGKNMFKSVSLDIGEKRTPSIAYGVMSGLQSVTNTIQKPLNFLLSIAGNSNEDLMGVDYDLDGYYNATLTTSLNPHNAKAGGTGVWDRKNGSWGSGIEDVIYRHWDGKFTAHSAILADGWNAQSVAYYEDRADNFVPSTIFDFTGFNEIKSIVGVLEGGIPSKSAIIKLNFSDVNVKPLPSPDSFTEDEGFYSYGE